MIFDYHDIPIHYTLSGKGTTLVLLHGFLESSSIWESITKSVTKQYQVLTIDLLGHGKSGYMSPSNSMRSQADMVCSLLDYLKIDSAIILGHSMGGYIALACVELHEQKVEKIILLNSKTASDSATQIFNRNRALEVIKTQKDTFISLAITNLFCESSKLTYKEKIDSLKTQASNFSLEGIMASVRGMRDRNDRTFLLQKFKKPKYILAGIQDAIVPFALSKKEAEETQSNLIQLSGSHMGWLENEAEIVNFLHFID